MAPNPRHSLDAPPPPLHNPSQMSAPSFSARSASTASGVAGVRGEVVVGLGVVIGLRGLLLIGSRRGEDHQEA